jgi:hypothetical protein
MTSDQDKQYSEATLEKGEPMTLVVSGKSHELRCNQVLQVSVGDVATCTKIVPTCRTAYVALSND